MRADVRVRRALECGELRMHGSILHKFRSIIDPGVVGIGNLIGAVISGIFWLTLASIVSVDEYGILSYYFSLAAMASVVSVLGFGGTIMTYLPKGSRAIVGQASIVVLVVSSIAAIALAIVFDSVAAAFLVLAGNAFTLSVAEQLAKKCYKRYSLVLIINKSSQFGLALALYYVMGINGIIVGYSVPSLVLGYRLFFSIRESGYSLDEVIPKLKFSLHVCINAISQSTATYGDKLIIAPLFGFAVLGLYHIGFQILMFLSVIPGSLYQYLLPQEAGGAESRLIRRLGLIFSVVLGLVFYGLSPYIISWLFPRYVDAIPAAQIMVFAVIPQTIISMTNARLLGRENSKPVVMSAIVYVTSLLALLYTLGTSQGLTGLALSTVASLSLQSCVLVLLSRVYGGAVKANTHT